VNKTSIEWVKNPDGSQGYTWNPITGCLNGCPYCYARKLANGRLKQRYLANENYATSVDFRNGVFRPSADAYTDPFYPRFWESRLDERKPPVARVQCRIRYGMPCSETFAYRKYNYKPKGIFVCDMSDLFGIGIPGEWTKEVLGVIKGNPKDRFYLLTKQGQNLAPWSPFPANCFVGVTYTGGDGFTKVLAGLKEIEATVKYLSIEPFLAEIPRLALVTIPKIVKWLIIGACTGRKNEILELCQRNPDLTPMPYGKIWTAQPKIEWVGEIVRAADKAGIPVFLKDNLEPLLNSNDMKKYENLWQHKTPRVLEFPLRIRQEMPEGGK